MRDVFNTQPSYRRWQLFVAIMLLTSATVVGLIYLSLQASRDFQQAFAIQRNLTDQQVEASLLLGSLRSQLGYGGMIHNFKNFVLRHEQRYFDQATQSSAASQATIDQLRALTGDMFASELEALETTLSSYQSNLAAIKDAGAENAEAIDRQVAVDDSAALAAIDSIQAQLDRDYRLAVTETQQQLANVQSYNAYVLPVLLLLALGVVVQGFVIYSLYRSGVATSRTRHLVEELFAQSPLAMIWQSAEGEVLLASDMALRLTGYKRNELRSVDAAQLFSRGERVIHDQMLRDLRELDDGTSSLVMRGQLLQRRDGSNFRVDLYLSRITVEQSDSVLFAFGKSGVF